MELKETTERRGCRWCGFWSLDYGVVAVLGAQSSGKSTLLNALFGMHFQVLSQESGRQRTTHGVWLGIAPQAPRGEVGSLVVLDVEGTDGNERQDELSFERKSSLFSLAVSSVLIVNIWFQDVGRYNAANLSLLKTVFDINLQLFGKEAESSRTLILFVIRDHVKTPLESLKATLMGDLQKVWASLQKPDGLENKTLGDYFDIDFAALPHLILDPEGFDREMCRLRARFLDPTSRAPLDPAAPEGSGWLLSPKHRKGIPADGFCQFTETIWDVIRQNKDLDLPSQRHMLATYRCEEMSDAAWKGFAAEARALFHDTVERDGEIAEGFGRAARALLRKWLASYRVPASRYLSEVSRKKGEELETKMLDELLRLFRLQVTAAVASTTRQLGTFAGSRLVTFFLDYGITYGGTLALGAVFPGMISVFLLGKNRNLAELLSKAVAAVIVVIANYVFSKLIVFRRKKERFLRRPKIW